VVALPTIKSNGSTFAAKNLVYEWERDLDPVPNSSGYGKNSFVFDHDFFNERERIGVAVSSLQNNAQARGEFFIRTHRPKIVFYEDHPLEGINYNRALNEDFTMKGKRLTIIAEPYFFSGRDARNADLDYSWSINDERVITPEQKNVLFIRAGEEDGGIALISLSIEHISKTFQSAVEEMNILLEQ